MRGLVRLYPAAWRARYGAEMEALLAERPMGLGQVADIVMGALDARRNPRELGLVAKGADPMSSLQAGRAAIVGGLLWSGAYLASYLAAVAAQASLRGMSRSEGAVWLVPLALAAVALSLVQVRVARNHPASGFLTRTATVLTGVGMLVMTGALLLGLVLPHPLVGDGGVTSEPWVVGMVLVLVGSGLFAGTLATGTRQRRALGAVLILSALSSAGLLVLSPADLVTTMRYSIAVASVGVAFGSAWAVFGVDLLRRERSRAAEPHATAT